MATTTQGDQPPSAIHPSPSKNNHVNHGNGPSDVLFFVDAAQEEISALRHAQKVASAFGGKVVLVHVMSHPPNGNGPVDPVDWDFKKHKTLKKLSGLSRSFDDTGQGCETKLLEGDCIGQISALMDARQGDIAAAVRSNKGFGWHQNDTACGVLLSRSTSLLMIPEDAAIPEGQAYRRILVPLDGSARAEAALPKATVLANAENAELVLCYVVPESGLTEFGVRDQETERLHAMVAARNERAGKTHLMRIKNSLAHNGLKISTRIIHDGDPRRALLDFVTRESVDLVVMATHGQSGHGDVPTGDVARFVLDRADIPVLMVRHSLHRSGNHAFKSVASSGVRQPEGTDR